MSPTGDLLVTFIFFWGRGSLELAQRLPRVALALHNGQAQHTLLGNAFTAAAECFGAVKTCLYLRRAGAFSRRHERAPRWQEKQRSMQSKLFPSGCEE